MILEKLLPPSRPGGRWHAWLEGGARLTLPESAVADCALYQGMDLSEDDLERLQAAASQGEARRRAAALLTARMMSRGQLADKLCAKGFSPQQAEDAVQWAQDIGLLNDESYARALVRRCQQRGYGIYKIKDELSRRKVPRAFWEDALAELEDPEESIDRLLAAKLPDPGDPKQVKRASDALVRRGFSWGEVSAGIRRRREAFDALDETDWRE